MKINELIPIDEKRKTVNARDEWQFLEVKTEFSHWINRRISEYNFEENEDYIVIVKNDENPKGGRPSKEYHNSISMAKELRWLRGMKRAKNG